MNIDNIELNIKKKEEKIKILNEKQEKIASSHSLEDSISQTIWEQFILQISSGAASEFFKENNNLNLSLDKADHYLKTDNFVNGIFPEHNLKNVDQYKERYSEWMASFKNSSRTEFSKNYRDDFDRLRAKGNDEFHMDHTIPISKLLKDEKLATFANRDDVIDFANDTDKNLKPLDAELNIRKGSQSVDELINDLRKEGKDISDFNSSITEEELKNRNRIANKELNKFKKDAESAAISEGKQSIRAEAIRSLSITADAILIALCAKLLREVIKEVIIWLKNDERKIKPLINRIRNGFVTFIKDIKNNVLLSVDVGVTTILTQIFGEIIISIRKALLLLQIGSRTYREIKKYLNDKENKAKEKYIQTIEIQKIAVKGGVSIGSILFSDIIHKIICVAFPPAQIPILPILGSPARVISIFISGMTAGIIGVLITNKLNSKLINEQLAIYTNERMELHNEVILLQETYIYEQQRNIMEAFYNEGEKNIKDFVSVFQKIEEMKKKQYKSENENSLDEIENIIKGIE